MIDLELPNPWLTAEMAGRRRRRPGYRVRPAAAALALLAVLLALTGPVNLESPLRLAWQVNALQGFLWLDDHAAYTARRQWDGVALVAQSLDTGQVLWRRELEGSFAEMYLGPAPMLLPRFPPFTRSPASTRVLDTTTGDVVGTYPVPAMPLVYFTDRVALVIDRAERSGGHFDGWLDAHRAVAVDLTTGELRWQRWLEPGTFWALPGVHPWLEGFVGDRTGSGWMAVVHPDGMSEVWDLATGRVAARAGVGSAQGWSYAVALPDAVIVNAEGWPYTVLSGYNPRTLARMWRTPLPPVGDMSAWPVPCGPHVCLFSPIGIWAVDQLTGTLLWHRPVVDLYAVSERAMAAATVDGPILLDTTTGQQRSLGEGWHVAKPRPRDGELVISRLVHGRTRLGLLNLDTGVATLLGDVGAIDIPDRCQATATHVACTAGEHIRVWRRSNPDARRAQVAP